MPVRRCLATLWSPAPGRSRILPATAPAKPAKSYYTNTSSRVIDRDRPRFLLFLPPPAFARLVWVRAVRERDWLRSRPGLEARGDLRALVELAFRFEVFGRAPGIGARKPASTAAWAAANRAIGTRSGLHET